MIKQRISKLSEFKNRSINEGYYSSNVTSVASSENLQKWMLIINYLQSRTNQNHFKSLPAHNHWKSTSIKGYKNIQLKSLQR